MQILSLIWGIFADMGMIVGFFPCLGALNWFNIPFAGVGVIISAIALGTAGTKPKGASIAGLVCCLTALFFGIIRLVLGMGIF
jgi:hypothetical protein